MSDDKNGTEAATPISTPWYPSVGFSYPMCILICAAVNLRLFGLMRGKDIDDLLLNSLPAHRTGGGLDRSGLVVLRCLHVLVRAPLAHASMPAREEYCVDQLAEADLAFQVNL